jgi:hypothetical protein
MLLSPNLSLSMDCILHVKTISRKCIKTLQRSNVLSKLKEKARTDKHQTTKRFKSNYFRWNMSHKSSHSIEPNLASTIESVFQDLKCDVCHTQ